jgi:three-Cys-motif partner protein
MSSKNVDFFKKKNIWSTVKDDLLECYLVPYFSKIMATGKPTVYIDCFAGAGIFEDDTPGSPLIALNCLDKAMSGKRNVRNPKVYMKFIELHHVEELINNIPPNHRSKCQVIKGRYENHIKGILNHLKESGQSINLFLYIDPYGIKHLNAELFDWAAHIFNSAELLINFNSLGFFRNACRLNNTEVREKDITEGLEEYDRSIVKTTRVLENIAGGDYWHGIIEKYKNKLIDGYQAEKEISRLYKERLGKHYKYVLDMPIRLAVGQHPKYRMVHATNHPHGCVLMADNIAKRTDRLVVDIQEGGQLSLVPQTVENEFLCDETLTNYLKRFLQTKTEYTEITDFLAEFYNKHGVICNVSRITTGNNSILKRLYKEDYIEVRRLNKKTKKLDDKSKVWNSNAKIAFEVRIKRE